MDAYLLKKKSRMKEAKQKKEQRERKAALRGICKTGQEFPNQLASLKR